MIRTITITLIVITLIFLIAVANYEQISPVLVEEIPPEQSPYAVLYYVCGNFQTVLMTTEPPVMGFAKELVSSELFDLLEATPLERMLELRYVGSECFIPNE